MNYSTANTLYTNAIDRILDRMPSNLTDIEKARYAYISMGHLFTFDENYWYGNARISSKIYRKSIHSPIDLDSLKSDKKRKAICIDINRSYNYFLKNKLGIEAFEFSPYYEDRHISSQFQIGKSKYLCDLQQDLKFIQLNLRTHNFCNKGFYRLSESELDRIDSKIGYSHIGEKYENHLFEKLKHVLPSYNNLGDKLSAILDSVSQMPGFRELSFSEIQTVYAYFISNFMDEKDKSNIHCNILYQEDSKDIRSNYTTVYSALTPEKGNSKPCFRRFIFSSIDNKFHEISDKNLSNLINSKNLKILHGEKIPGVSPRFQCHDDDFER